MQGWNLPHMESAGKADYGKLLTAKYWDFAHVNTTRIPSE